MLFKPQEHFKQVNYFSSIRRLGGTREELIFYTWNNFTVYFGMGYHSLFNDNGSDYITIFSSAKKLTGSVSVDVNWSIWNSNKWNKYRFSSDLKVGDLVEMDTELELSGDLNW